MKHAKASTLDIYLYLENKRIHCDIQDNGLNKQRYQVGNGLIGMKERLHGVDGELNHGFNGQGFYLKIPFASDLVGITLLQEVQVNA